jgi:hypothetical protein
LLATAPFVSLLLGAEEGFSSTMGFWNRGWELRSVLVDSRRRFLGDSTISLEFQNNLTISYYIFIAFQLIFMGCRLTDIVAFYAYQINILYAIDLKNKPELGLFFQIFSIARLFIRMTNFSLSAAL